MNVLIPNALAIPISDEDIGRFVFQQYLHEDFELEHVDEEILHEDVQNAGDNLQVQGFQANNEIAANKTVRYLGAHLRELAVEFGQSRQGEAVRQHADEVDLGALTYTNFWNLLNEVFLHGVTGYNLVALFTFCSHVLIRCVRNNLRNIGLNLFRWALEYVVREVVRWVAEHGGWEAVLRGAWNNRVVRYVAGAILIGGLSFLVYKGIKS